MIDKRLFLLLFLMEEIYPYLSALHFVPTINDQKMREDQTPGGSDGNN
jgi:hypothetical protein